MFSLRFGLRLSPLLMLVAFLFSCATPEPMTVVTAVSIEANGSKCTPDKIETKQGYIIKLALKNSGTTPVAFTFPDAPYTFTALPGETAAGNFTAPTQTGNYKFQCGTVGASDVTQGTLQVKSNQ